jgi:uncharacterized membrane-anchored protein
MYASREVYWSRRSVFCSVTRYFRDTSTGVHSIENLVATEDSGMSPLRIGLVGAAILLTIVGAWQYFTYKNMSFWIAIACFVVAAGCALGFFLTRPEEKAEDISITRF